MNPITFLRLFVREARPWQLLVCVASLSCLVTMIVTSVWALTVPL